ncbi:MAG: hypothetical protein JW759_00150 [Candidatus Coatesbacteria bacterium]|nr:hypothetical protein [Candidatus Coatesbacteria bacterium]
MTRQNRDNVRQTIALFLTTAYRAIRLNPLQFSLSALALAVFSFMFSFFIATSHASERLASKLIGTDHLTVFVRGGLERKQTDALIVWAKSHGFVRDVEQRAFESYFLGLCDSLGLDAKAFGEIPSTVVPEVLVVTLDSDEASRNRLSQFVTELRARSDVLDAHFDGDALLGLSELVRRFKGLVCALLVVCCLIASAMLFLGGRTVVASNEDAIGIMKLAGASARTLAGPFACYAVLQWASGLVLALLLWHILFPIGAVRAEGSIAELEGLVAPQLSVLDALIVALTTAALSLVPILLVHRSKLRAMDVFSR